MSFTSPQFLIFFALVCGLSKLAKESLRSYILLGVSLFFIGTFNMASLAAVIVFSSFTFIAAKYIYRSTWLFYIALLINIMAIVIFNYISASRGSLVFSFSTVEFDIGNLILVVGLSFYSLQHIAYLVDVRKQRIAAETNYVDFLLISAYFPKFISGPLTLYQQLKPALFNQAYESVSMWQGFNRMLWGFFKKMVIADRLAPSVSSVFDYQDELPGITILSGAVLFTIQLYFDFSAYSDIAVGASKMLGINLPENFNFPLRATSVTVFWRRWHRSLIHFFTTYIFYPVSFKYRRLKKHASAIAIVITFLISGLWHGIGFTFMMWALCHMAYLLAELYFGKHINAVQDNKNILRKALRAAFVLMLVSFSNIFFRSTTTQGCLHLLQNLFSGRFFPASWPVDFVAPIAVGGHQLEHFNLILTLMFTFLFLAFERKIFVLAGSGRFRPLITFMVILIIFLFGVFDNGQRFIYMQF